MFNTNKNEKETPPSGGVDENPEREIKRLTDNPLRSFLEELKKKE
jgi:hypothetical protein